MMLASAEVNTRISKLLLPAGGPAGWVCAWDGAAGPPLRAQTDTVPKQHSNAVQDFRTRIRSLLNRGLAPVRHSGRTVPDAKVSESASRIPAEPETRPAVRFRVRTTF